MRRLHSRFGRLGVLLAKELRDLARDRKVLYAAILLPALLFPVLIAFSGKLFHRAERTVSETSIRIGIVGAGPEIDQIVGLTSGSSWARGGGKRQILDGELDAVLMRSKTAAGVPHYSLLYDSSREDSRIAAQRLETSIETVIERARVKLLERASPVPVHLEARSTEVADIARTSGNETPDVPRFLPMLLVLILLSASAFAAIDLFPGERERGTLETLLVQPMFASEVLAAKYIAVFVVSMVAVAANLTGILMSSAIARESNPAASLSLAALGGIFLLSLPLALFLSAFLVRVVARAQSVREAQNYLLPLTLICLLPPFLAGSPDVPFDGFTACIPLAGPALAFREVCGSRIDWIPLLLMLVSTLVASVLVLAGTLKHLANEEHLLATPGAGRPRAARCIALVLASILGMYAIAPFFQGLHPALSLGLPLVLFVGIPPLVLGRWAGFPARRLLRVRAPSSRAIATATCMGIGLALLSTSLAALQADVLPMPTRFRDAASDVLGGEPMHWAILVGLFALMPALLEEILYRRVLLQTLLKSTSTLKALVLTAALFALHHLSIYRFVPTFAAGLCLGWIVLRTHSFWAAPIAHAVSNGLVVLSGAEGTPLAGTQVASFVTDPSHALARIPIALALILLPYRVLYYRSTWVAAKAAG